MGLLRVENVVHIDRRGEDMTIRNFLISSDRPEISSMKAALDCFDENISGVFIGFVLIHPDSGTSIQVFHIKTFLTPFHLNQIRGLKIIAELEPTIINPLKSDSPDDL